MTSAFNVSALTTAQPYGELAKLRTQDPVHWSPALKAWLVTRYADVTTVLQDEETYSASRMRPFFDGMKPEQAQSIATLQRYIPLWVAFRTGDDHTRLRGVLRKAFSPKTINEMRKHVVVLVDELIDEFIARGSVELMKEFSLRLPGYIILDMLGAPRADLDHMTHYTNELQLFLGQAQGVAARYERAEAAVVAMEAYFKKLIAQKRDFPGDDLTTMLVAAVAEGQLSEDELIAYCILIFFGGQETTANLIGNGLITLMAHPQELKKLQDNPELVRAAVVECLRYDGPIGAVVRVISRDHIFAGKQLHRGERVFAMINAANRDPAQFPDPDHFDITRSDSRHLTFGQGIHFCMGAALASIEAEIALAQLITRLKDLRHAREGLDWRDGLNMRGVVTLPLLFQPASPLKQSIELQ